MQGLLDFLKTPAGQGLLAAGLGAAATAGRGGPLNTLGRGGLMGLQAYTGAQEQEAMLAERAKMGELRDVQMEAYKADAARKNEALEGERRRRAALPNLFKQPGMTGGEAVPQSVGGIPMFSQPMGVSPMQATPGGFDVMGALQAGYTPEEIEKLANIPNAGRPKATRQMEVDDGKGGKRIALVDDFGREVANFSGYTPPVQVNRGDRIDFVKPAPGVSLGVNMSPSERDASSRGWAGLNETKRHNSVSEANANAGRVPPGYRMNPDGTMSAIPGGPADLKAGAEGQKRTTDAKDVLGLLDEVDALLPQATGSYLGAGVDQAARFFGASTGGADATAQLKTLQGALIGKMPKMSGPQSDKDVQLYREMAGQVGDPTLPVGTRQKASETIRRLNEKYAGMPEGSSKKASVVKTGVYGGRKVEQLSDGTVRYAN